MIRPEEMSEEFRARYSLLEPIGEGASGHVFKARQIQLGREVAIKFLTRTRDAGFDIIRRRFEKEARILATMEHPQIMKVFDFGVDLDRPYIVMELHRSRTLRHRMVSGELYPVADAVRLIADVLDPLSYVHDKGVIHRDLKPENLLLTESGSLLIADFGLVRCDDHHTLLTQEGQVVGTARYLAPEVLTRTSYSTASDLYAMGTILFELLVGVPPFKGPGLLEIVQQKISSPAPPIRSIDPTIPEDLAGLIDGQLDRDPERRHATASSFQAALQEFLRQNTGAGAGPTTVDTTLPAPAVAPSRPQSVPGPGAQPQPREVRCRAPVIAALVVLSAMLGILSLTKGRTREVPGPSGLARGDGRTAIATAPARPLAATEAGRLLLETLERFQAQRRFEMVVESFRKSKASKVKDAGVRGAWVRETAQSIHRAAAHLGLPDALRRFDEAVKRQSGTIAPLGRADLDLYFQLNHLAEIRLFLQAVSRDREGLGSELGDALPACWAGSPRPTLARARSYTIKKKEFDKPIEGGTGDVAPEVVAGWPRYQFQPERYKDGGEAWRHVTQHGLIETLDLMDTKKLLAYHHPAPLPLPPATELAAIEIGARIDSFDPNGWYTIRIRIDEDDWRNVAVMRRIGDSRLCYLALDPRLFHGRAVRIGVKGNNLMERVHSYDLDLDWITVRWTTATRAAGQQP